MISLDEFVALPDARMAEIVSKDHPLICAFPINGTRRWYQLQLLNELSGQTDDLSFTDTLGELESSAPLSSDDEAAYLEDYVQRLGRRQATLARLFFGHGIGTLITSLFGQSLVSRGEVYISVGLRQGLGMLRDDPAFQALYEEMGVQVRFYGDYRNEFPGLGLGDLVDLCDEVMEMTAAHHRHHWFCGLYADAPQATIAQLTVAFYQSHKRIPSRAELIQAYYGVALGPLDLFIGFDKPAVFDVPLLDMTATDLYFMVSPSPYLDRIQLRHILYDHLYTRRAAEQNYPMLSPGQLETMRAFYDANRRGTLGVGNQQPDAGFWYPLPQVTLTPGLDGDA